MGTAIRDNYNSPLDAPVDWWSTLPASRILLVAGADELFVDDIVEFAHKLSVCNPVLRKESN